MEQIQPIDLSSYPAIDLAYPIAFSSYESVAKRFDSLDARIQTLMAWGTALTLAAFAMFKGSQQPFRPHWFGIAISLFLTALALGIIARLWGGLTLVSPKVLYDSYLHLPEPEFKKNSIYWAGKHFEANCRLIKIKHRLTVASMLFFFLEVLVLAV